MNTQSKSILIVVAILGCFVVLVIGALGYSIYRRIRSQRVPSSRRVESTTKKSSQRDPAIEAIRRDLENPIRSNSDTNNDNNDHKNNKNKDKNTNNDHPEINNYNNSNNNNNNNNNYNDGNGNNTNTNNNNNSKSISKSNDDRTIKRRESGSRNKSANQKIPNTSNTSNTQNYNYDNQHSSDDNIPSTSKSVTPNETNDRVRSNSPVKKRTSNSQSHSNKQQNNVEQKNNPRGGSGSGDEEPHVPTIDQAHEMTPPPAQLQFGYNSSPRSASSRESSHIPSRVYHIKVTTPGGSNYEANSYGKFEKPYHVSEEPNLNSIVEGSDQI